MSSLQKRVLVSKLGGGGLPPRGPRPVPATGGRGRRDYTPIHFSRYFPSSRNVTVDKGDAGTNTFRVYQIGSDEGPAIFMLHGGGFSGLTWSLVSQTLNSLIKCRIFAMDIRGHGDTKTIDDANLSAETLAEDIADVIEAIMNEDFPETSEHRPPDVVLIGHSMGGALAVHAALGEKPIPNLVGICVIDVVEGTAMDALSSMQSFLRSRPTKFASLEQAIEWCVRSGQVRNSESARVSMPGQLCNMETGLCAVHDVSEEDKEANARSECGTTFAAAPANVEAIAEEEDETLEDGEDHSKPTDCKLFKTPTSSSAAASSSASPPSAYRWRIDLGRTEPFWTGWFSGLSSKFLSVPTSKLLLLAGVDRLDRDLTVGQMQGKFQMQILPQAGHAVHEDVPDRVAEVLASFLVRNKVATPTAEFTPALPGC